MVRMGITVLFYSSDMHRVADSYAPYEKDTKISKNYYFNRDFRRGVAPGSESENKTLVVTTNFILKSQKTANESTEATKSSKYPISLDAVPGIPRIYRKSTNQPPNDLNLYFPIENFN